MFWIGVLVGLGVAIIARTLITVLLGVVALLALGAFHLASHHAHVSASGIGPWLLVAGAAIVVGVILGRARTLRHMGEAEFKTRLSAVKKVSRW